MITIVRETEKRKKFSFDKKQINIMVNFMNQFKQTKSSKKKCKRQHREESNLDTDNESGTSMFVGMSHNINKN